MTRFLPAALLCVIGAQCVEVVVLVATARWPDGWILVVLLALLAVMVTVLRAAEALAERDAMESSLRSETQARRVAEDRARVLEAEVWVLRRGGSDGGEAA